MTDSNAKDTYQLNGGADAGPVDVLTIHDTQTDKDKAKLTGFETVNNAFI